MNSTKQEHMIKAAKYVNLNEVIRLIDSGINPNYIGIQDSRTALHYAIINKDLNMITYLLSVNASNDIKDSYGKRPSDYNQVPNMLKSLDKNALPGYDEAINVSSSSTLNKNYGDEKLVRIKIYKGDTKEILGTVFASIKETIKEVKENVKKEYYYEEDSFKLRLKCYDHTKVAISSSKDHYKIENLMSTKDGDELYVRKY